MLSRDRKDLIYIYLEEFQLQYLRKEEGKTHLRKHREESELVKLYWDKIKEMEKEGADITDSVLKKLLPYNNTKHNRENGCRISVSPAITKDVKTWFENAGWQTPEKWPLVAKSIYQVIFELFENSNWDILHEFENNTELSKGLKSGMLTPTLFHLDNKFLLINSKNIDTVNYLTEKKIIDNSLKSYQKNIDIINELLKELNYELFKDYMYFDMFCHWMCAKRLGGYARFAKTESNFEVNEPDVGDIVDDSVLEHEESVPANHWEAIYYIIKIGNLLGYDTYVADPSKTAFNIQLREIANLSKIPKKLQSIPEISKIDAIWYKSVPPFFFFEVEHGGTMREALHRLYNTIIFDAIFLIICPESNHPKFERWVTTQPFHDIRQRYNFRNYEQLYDFYKTVSTYTTRKKRFLTVD